jgi:hypothetical protein
MAKVSTRRRTKTANTTWIQSRMSSTKTDIMKTNIMLRTKEITTVTNTIMTTATSIRLLGTISNTISLLDRTREVNSLELSRGKVDLRKVQAIDRILALVVNSVTLSLMI